MNDSELETDTSVYLSIKTAINRALQDCNLKKEYKKDIFDGETPLTRPYKVYIWMQECKSRDKLADQLRDYEVKSFAVVHKLEAHQGSFLLSAFGVIEEFRGDYVGTGSLNTVEYRLQQTASMV